MDALPDELLLRILSMVEDGRTLLQSVPLVCKRWHALHLEPEAWAGVRFEEYPDDDDRARADAALLLARAPYMHCLSTYALGDARMFAALRRGGLVVREFRTSSVRLYEATAEDRGAILDLLYRSRHTLRVAEVELDTRRDSNPRTKALDRDGRYEYNACTRIQPPRTRARETVRKDIESLSHGVSTVGFFRT